MMNGRAELEPLAQEVLGVWLGTNYLTPDGLAAAVERWFKPPPAVDAHLRERFHEAVAQARDGVFDKWCAIPHSWLALLILLDQFPRNIHRGTPLAFASDAKAQTVALDGMARGHDRHLDLVERVFAYLPFEHAEDLALQDRSVEAFRDLRDQAPDELADTFAVFLDYAVRHRDVIAQFGRFPHRNAILSRASSEAELTYLAQPDAGF